MPLFRSKTRLTNGLRGDGWATPEYYGAKGIDGVNDLPAFAAAADDLGATGGKLLLGPKTYQLDGLLSWPSNVSVKGVPDATYVNWNHATTNQLVFLSYNQGGPITFEDIRFIGKVANTGTCVRNYAGARVIFNRCTWNGFTPGGAPSSNLQGKIVDIATAASEVYFYNCRAEVAGLLNGFQGTDGKLGIFGGMLKMPAAYSAALVYLDTDMRAEIATRLDCTGHTSNPSGQGKGVYVVSSSAMLNLHDAEIDATGASVLTNGAGWVAGARIDVANLRTLGNIDRFFVDSTALPGSNIELLPSLAIDHATAGAIIVPRGVRAYVIKCSTSSGTTIELPTGLFPGQELLLTYYNSNGSSSNAVTFVTTPLTAVARASTLASLGTLTAVFVWESRDASGAYRWVQKGTWGDGGVTIV